MKRIVSFWAAVMICCAMHIQAVNYCATSSWGYAGNVTGGGNATPTVSNGGIPAGFSQLSVVANLAKGTWEQGYLNMGVNADYITFDFSAYDAVIEAVEFDVTIPNLDANKNTISYHWNSETNTSYTISSKNTETVQLTAPANAKSFTIQRSAGTSTRISQVCFQITALTPSDTEALTSIPNQSAARKVLRHGQVLILRDGKIYTVTGQSL